MRWPAPRLMGRRLLLAAFLAAHIPAKSMFCSADPSPAPAPSASSAVYGDTPGGSFLFPIVQGSFHCRASTAAIDWNVATQWSIRNTTASNLGPRIFTIVSVGIWQALEANSASPSPADPTAVVGYAGRYLLLNFFPQLQAKYDALLALETASLSDEAREQARNVSDTVASALLASRSEDGFMDPQSPPPRTAPPGGFVDVGSGDYRGVQQYANSDPFVLPSNMSGLDFIANCPPPVAYPSDSYDSQLTATNLMGRDSSQLRSADQTKAALFWADAPTGTCGIVGHWNQVVLAALHANTTLQESAEVLARFNVAMYDSIVAVSRLKYWFSRWRPVTALRTGDTTHTPIPNWTPLLLTPNNPTYPSNQGALAGSAEVILTDFFGTDSRTFSVGTEIQNSSVVLQSRTYPGFAFAAAEVTQSRYFGGIESPSDAVAGRSLGNSIAQYVIDNFGELVTPL